MPSVITKPQENGAPQVQETSIQAAIAIVEKKVRNLEKRKGKLDSYRDILKRGKALNEDQQSAVDKYEEVIGTLDFTKELMGQFAKLAQDEVRDKKKMMKKEQQERAKEETNKVSYILAVKEILSSVQEEGFLSDLLKTEGAPKLTSEQVEQLKQFAQLVTPDREINEKGSFDKQVNNSAKHLVNLSDKKTLEVAGTTYKDLNTLISTIRESGYVESKWAKDSATNTEADTAVEADYDTQDTQEDDEEMPPTEPIVKETTPTAATNGHSITNDSAMLGHNTQPQEPMPVFPSPPQQKPQPVVAEPQPPVPQQQPAAPPPPQPAVPEPSFNFLQESQIDLESPHMDPAVVMVHPAKRPAVAGPGAGPAVHPPGMAAGYVDHSRQMLQQLHIQQQHHQQLLASHQAQQQLAAPTSLAGDSSYNTAFEAPKAQAGQQQQQPGLANGAPAPGSAAPPFPGTAATGSPAERPAPSTDPRAPRVPDGTPQHADPSPGKPPVYSPASQPSGYAAAAGGSQPPVKQPDTEIGTWRPEGAPAGGEDEEEDGRQGGDKGRRGRGGGGRGYSRGRGDRGGYRGRGGDRGEGYRGRGGDRDGYRGGRGGERRQYDDRKQYEDRRDDRPRGSGGRGGGYRGRGGRGGGGGQNGFRE